MTTRLGLVLTDNDDGDDGKGNDDDHGNHGDGDDDDVVMILTIMMMIVMMVASSYSTEMEKRNKIAQTQVLDLKIAQNTRNLRHIIIHAKTA